MKPWASSFKLASEVTTLDVMRSYCEALGFVAKVGRVGHDTLTREEGMKPWASLRLRTFAPWSPQDKLCHEELE